MWDAALIARVRDRKLNEILIFASMAKIDPSRIDDYIDIIVSLGDDIDACDTLLETEGKAEISLDAIDREEYVSRLSPGEAADEDAFNAMKAEPEDAGVMDREYVRSLIADAVDSIVSQMSSSSDEDRARADMQFDSLRDAYGELEAEHTQSLEKVSELEAEVLRLTRELDESREDAASQSAEVLAAENARLSAEVQRLLSVLQESERGRSELAMANEAAGADIEAIRAEASKVPSLRSELQAATIELEEARRRNTDLERSVMSLTAERDELMRKTFETESLRAINEELRAKVDSMSVMKADLAEANSLLAARAEEMDTLRDRADAADSLKDALSDLKEELKAVRQRNESLSSELDYAKESIATAESDRAEAERRCEELEGKLRESKERNRRMMDVVDSGITYACQEKPCEPRPEPAEEPAPEPAADRPIVDRILTEEELEALRQVKALKEAKIDGFIDMSLAGKLKDEVCDDVVTFLKVDITLCDALLGMDYTDFKSIVDGFRTILDTLENSPDPRFQNRYLRTLTREERAVEDVYVAIINKAHDILATRYLRFVGRSSA